MTNELPKSRVAAPGPTSSQPAVKRHGAPNEHMHKALALLQQAQAELQLAKRDTDGHRGDAVREIDLAITDIKQGIAFSEAKRSLMVRPR